MAKQFSRTTTTTFRWWRDDGKNVRKCDEKALFKNAELIVKLNTEGGNVCGDMYRTISTGVHNKREICYRGWWKIKTT